MKMPERVTICEVGTRDGFQIEPEFIPTDGEDRRGEPSIRDRHAPHRGDLVRVAQGDPDAEGRRARSWRASRGGPARATPRWCPTTRARCGRWTRGVDDIHTVVSASESHNLANVNMTIAESLGQARARRQQVAHRARHARRTPASPARSAARSRATCRSPSSSRSSSALVDLGAARHRPRRHHRHGQSRAGRPRARAPDPALPRRRVDAPHPRHAGDGDPEHPVRDGARA